jgi:hypothetical protein
MSLRVIAWAAFIISSSAATTLRAGDLSPVLPTDAHFVATAPQMKVLATAWADTSLGKLVQGNDMQPFRAELEANNVACLLRLRPWFGWDWAELADVPGQVTVGIFPSAPVGGVVNAPPAATKTKGPPAATVATPPAPQAEFVCLLAKGNDDKAVAACRAAGEAYYRKLGATPTTRQVGKVACMIYTYKPKTGSAQTTVFFATEQYEGAATSIRGAELVLARLATPPAPAAAASEKVLASFALEPLPLGKLLTKPPAKGKRNLVKFFERQGGGEINLVSGAIDLPATGALELSLDAELKGNFPLSKGLGILNYQVGAPADLTDYFGKTAHKVRHWRWDFSKTMKSIANLFDEWNEPGPSGEGLFDDLLDGLRDDPEGPKVDLRKDLFSQLGPSITELMIDGDKAKVPPVQHKLVMIDCINQDNVKATLEKYYKNDKKVLKDNTNGILIWHVQPGGSLFVEGKKGKNNKQSQSYEAATVTGNVLYLSENYEVLLEYFAARAKVPEAKAKARLVATDQAALAVAGKTVGYRGLTLSEQTWRIPYERLQAAPVENEPMNIAMLRVLLFGNEESRPAGIGKTLPGYLKVQPHALPTFNLLKPEGAGMHWQYGIVR